MSANEQPKGAVRRFIDLLVGADRPYREQRFDVRLARALVEEMRRRVLSLGSRKFPPIVYRVTLSAADVAQQHLNQSVVKSRYEAYVGGEVAHEMGRLIGTEVSPSALTVEFDTAEELSQGQIQVESWYGALKEGDAEPVVDSPSVAADGIITAFTSALHENALSVGGQTIMPHHFAAWLTPDDYRFWTQYPEISQALREAVLLALVERVSAAEHGAKVSREQFVITYLPDKNVSSGQIDLMASMDPISLGEDGAATTESPAASTLDSNGIVAAFISALHESTVTVGNDILVPYYFVAHLNPTDYSFWTHYPHIHRRLLAHLREQLAEAIGQTRRAGEGAEVSPSDVHVGMIADESVPVAGIRVEASLDPLPIPEEPPVEEKAEAALAAEEAAPPEPAPAAVVESVATKPEEPVRAEKPPLLLLEVSDAEQGGEPVVYPVTALPVTVGRIGGQPEVGKEYLPLDLMGGMSRRHFILDRSGDRFIVTLLPGVTNKTRVRGQEIAPGKSVAVAPGDELSVATITVRFLEPPAKTAITKDHLREAFGEACERFGVTIGETKLLPQRIIIWLSPGDYDHWSGIPDLTKTLAEIAADAMGGVRGEIPTPLLMPADDLPPAGIRTSASWVSDDGKQSEAVPGPPALTWERMREQLRDVPPGKSCRLTCAAEDYAYWNQSPAVFRAFVENIASALALSEVHQVVVEASATLPPGEVAVAMEERAAPSFRGPWATLEVVEPGAETRKYAVAALPAVVGRRGGSIGKDEYYLGLEGVAEMSRRHLLLAVIDGVLTLTAMPESRNETSLDGVVLPREVPKPIAFGQIIAVGQVRLTVQPPDPPSMPLSGWRNALEGAARAVEKPVAGGLLTVRLDAGSFVYWTAYAQLERLFVSMVREALEEVRSPRDAMATKVAGAEPSGPEIALEPDPALAEGEVRFVCPESDLPTDGEKEVPSPGTPATNGKSVERTLGTEAVLAPMEVEPVARLVVQQPDGQTEQFPIPAFPVTFGRAPSGSGDVAHVMVSDTRGYLAPVHARIEKTEAGFRIILLDPSAGRTLVSGRPLTASRPVSLSATDLIQVGTMRIRVEPS